MSRFSGGDLTGAGSATLPVISLYAIAAKVGKLREIGFFNTTGTAVTLLLVRLTTAGTQGADLVEGKHNPDSAPSMTLVGTHTVAPTLGDELGYRTILPATIGAGVIWTMGDEGIIIPAGTGNGIGLIPVGTGQALEAYMVWDE